LKKLVFLYFSAFFLLCISTAAWALVPLENAVLGSFSKDFRETYSDPLDYLFDVSTTKTSMEDQDFKNKLGIYRGFYEEGRNLEGYCKNSNSIRYRKKWQREQSKLSMAATLQYIGLDLTSMAIAKYSKELGYDDKQYSNLVENIVGNYCSRNTSVISVKQLKGYLKTLYKKNEFKLPSLEGSPLFSFKLGNQKPLNQIYAEELKATIELFKGFCSWGTAVSNYRLMTPLIRNPIVASYIIRQMANQKLAWDPITSQVFIKENKKSIKVACRGLICRRVDSQESIDKQFLGIGFESYSNDLKRLYCQDIRDVDYRLKGENKTMKGWINSQTLDLQNLLVGQFTALLTGIPDFTFRINEFTDLIRLAKLGIDLRWENWANLQIKSDRHELYYEEPLTVEVVNRDLYFVPIRENFQVQIDVNLGEFDRTNQMVGKITTRFDIKLKRKLMYLIQRKILAGDMVDERYDKTMIKRIERTIKEQIATSQKKLKYAPWAKGLPRLIAVEVYRQLEYYENFVFNGTDKGDINIPIMMNYAPFALKYMQELHRANKTNLTSSTAKSK
jgi:hypothetical protein